MPHHPFINNKVQGGDATITDANEWNAALIDISSTFLAQNPAVGTMPLSITVGDNLQVLYLERCDITTDNDNDADIAVIPNGTVVGQKIDLVCTSVGTSTSNTLTFQATFTGGGTSYTLPWIGVALVQAGMSIVWDGAGWVVSGVFQTYGGDTIEFLEPTLVDPPPMAGMLQMYTKNIGGRLMPKWIGPSGVDTPIQPFFGMNRCRMAYGTNATAALQVFGCAMTTTGTATAYTSAITSKYTAMNHAECLVTVAAVGTIAAYRDAALDKFLGNAAGMGGFFMVMRGGPATGVATAASNFFMGMGPTAAPTAVEPSTISQMIGIGYDGADTQLTFMCKNSGTVVKTALNTTNFPVASFPLSANKAVPTTDRTDLYELVLFAAPNSPTINWRATDLITGAQWSGSVTAGTNAGPAVNTALCPKMWSTSMATSSVIGVALASYYCETDF